MNAKHRRLVRGIYNAHLCQDLAAAARLAGMEPVSAGSARALQAELQRRVELRQEADPDQVVAMDRETFHLAGYARAPLKLVRANFARMRPLVEQAHMDTVYPGQPGALKYATRRIRKLCHALDALLPWVDTHVGVARLVFRVAPQAMSLGVPLTRVAPSPGFRDLVVLMFSTIDARVSDDDLALVLDLSGLPPDPDVFERAYERLVSGKGGTAS
jgi:hypothetical protein